MEDEEILIRLMDKLDNLGEKCSEFMLESSNRIVKLEGKVALLWKVLIGGYSLLSIAILSTLFKILFGG